MSSVNPFAALIAPTSPLGRIREFYQGRAVRGKVVFTGVRRRMTAVTVRGDQLAPELNGICLRSRYVTPDLVASSPAVFWIVRPDVGQVKSFHTLAPQFLDIINPPIEGDRKACDEECRTFRYLLANTASTRNYLCKEPEWGWRLWVVPHHHCNVDGWILPEERVAKPKVVGYVGETDNLHDAEIIEKRVRDLGLDFRAFPSRDLDGYKQIDIGLAWVRRDEQNDATRSNIKLANFASYGIPSVVCDFESYREVNAKLGGVAQFASTLDEFIQGLDLVAANEALRRQFNSKASQAIELYSRRGIAKLYRQAIDEARAEQWRP